MGCLITVHWVSGKPEQSPSIFMGLAMAIHTVAKKDFDASLRSSEEKKIRK